MSVAVTSTREEKEWPVLWIDLFSPNLLLDICSSSSRSENLLPSGSLSRPARWPAVGIFRRSSGRCGPESAITEFARHRGRILPPRACGRSGARIARGRPGSRSRMKLTCSRAREDPRGTTGRTTVGSHRLGPTVARKELLRPSLAAPADILPGVSPGEPVRASGIARWFRLRQLRRCKRGGAGAAQGLHVVGGSVSPGERHHPKLLLTPLLLFAAPANR